MQHFPQTLETNLFRLSLLLLLLGALDGLGSNVGHLGAVVAVHLHELGDVKLGRLEDLHLAHVHVLQGVDARARLLNLLAHALGDELVDKLLEVAGLGLTFDMSVIFLRI